MIGPGGLQLLIWMFVVFTFSRNATAVGVPAQIVRINGEKVRRYADEVDQTNVVNPTLQKIEALTRRVEELEKKLEEAENKKP